jgi:hypothetical protein
LGKEGSSMEFRGGFPKKLLTLFYFTKIEKVKDFESL